ncbi:bifunctional UDP-N-acetylglucosamine diphosphorylase/glucosamine-1-phosphate N-acetyltransferase GlmU [Zhaonella formicivorans]|uniref:bifunctional UDP-N-acetylglucosamine diphosphorylase/glucosamine-1-phosphate N-acetyltransferase GlmU n=1 Tax=Zhaonella formicivorans TaxID=2528593 RepID=UPI0010E1FFBC|nr:bifunctional UDP-N-acetylglucosamine diphosphorylase/glucosamine-1-phosphate N-acetyltransferase GlmU [Zhaonella formicivorans]
MGRVAAVILAAGKGTRMRSQLPKVLHKVAGKYLIQHVLDTCKKLLVDKIIIIVGHQGELVQEKIGQGPIYAWQREQLGTGHAVLQAGDFITEDVETVLLVCGDTPLLTADTLQNLLEMHQGQGAAATVLTTCMPDPTGYGRIVRDDRNEVVRIVEQKDATPEELAIQEINSGSYCFNARHLKEALLQIRPDNAQGEYYLTDVIAVFKQQGLKVLAYETEDPEEIAGINSRIQLAQAEAVFRRRINEKLMGQGVTILDPGNTYIEGDVQIAPDTVIYPYTFLQGRTVIGRECEIGPNCTIKDSTIAAGVTVTHSVIVESEIGENCQIGPYSYLRPGTRLGRGVKVGDFVELKKTVVGEGSKIPHLSYIGDAVVGQKVNIGAGTITCNYDGKNKWLTEIEDGAFIGSNSNLVAPVKVERNAYVAAGSTITENVPAGALGVARGRQANIPGWVKEKKKQLEEK